MEKEDDKSKPTPMGSTVERVSALSDGVFAVAITLLVLSIAVPTISGTVTESKLAHGLAQLWPHFFAYVLGFIISIGIAFASPTAAQYFWIALFATPLLERLVFRKKRGGPGVETQEAA